MDVGNNFDPKHLETLATYKMPFGKFKDQYLLDIPEAYYVWFQKKGWPEGKLGRLMQEVFEIKINGLEPILRKLRP